ncbi:MlaD family protein [Rhodococcus sp. USK13]|uniref:MlaD family protein n=1 Tax=Rhodococcus sp. USK13 TaxID=2806442 RepID=UPI002016D488|nr:MlaD family protein [Rhodococcus sp. USK13]
MQRTIMAALSPFRRIVGGPRQELTLGIVVVVVVVLALTATAMVYINPPGRKTISFETTDAAAIEIGDDVRVAGISVGQVTALSIEPSVVRVTAEVKRDVSIGTDSRIDVRMLTPVGGYAVSILPMGGKDLGSGIIPVDRVSVPYSIADVLQAAPTVTDKVSGDTIDANIDQTADALQRNPGSLATIISGMDSIATVMDHQREQIRDIVNMAAQYMQTFNQRRDFVFDLIRRIEVVLSTYHNTHAGFNEAYALLGEFLYRLVPLEQFYLAHEPEMRPKIEQLRDSIGAFQQDFGPAIDQLQQLRDRLAAWLTPEGIAQIGGGTILASSICVPVPGGTC